MASLPGVRAGSGRKHEALAADRAEQVLDPRRLRPRGPRGGRGPAPRAARSRSGARRRPARVPRRPASLAPRASGQRLDLHRVDVREVLDELFGEVLADMGSALHFQSAGGRLVLRQAGQRRVLGVQLGGRAQRLVVGLGRAVLGGRRLVGDVRVLGRDRRLAHAGCLPARTSRRTASGASRTIDEQPQALHGEDERRVRAGAERDREHRVEAAGRGREVGVEQRDGGRRRRARRRARSRRPAAPTTPSSTGDEQAADQRAPSRP